MRTPSEQRHDLKGTRSAEFSPVSESQVAELFAHPDPKPKRTFGLLRSPTTQTTADGVTTHHNLEEASNR